ncbi:MAG: hypothetical protein ACPGWR_20250 [Ardenticatenaceae bacterium]
MRLPQGLSRPYYEQHPYYEQTPQGLSRPYYEQNPRWSSFDAFDALISVLA